jgi:hypothetical protein
MAWREGVPFVFGFMDKIAECDCLYSQWSPKLREFVRQCRVANPIPPLESLPPRERAKLPIYEAKIQNAERLPSRRRSEVVFCCLPVEAIPVAQQSWPGDDERSVFLTADELSRWRQIYRHPESSFWWFIHYWWTVEDPPKPNGRWSHGKVLTVPDGADPWLVVSGLHWGALAGGEVAELWSWNGKDARFVKHVGHCQF